MVPFIDYGLCEGCGACADEYPGLFVMRDDLAWVLDLDSFSGSDAAQVEAICPFGAIKVS